MMILLIRIFSVRKVIVAIHIKLRLNYVAARVEKLSGPDILLRLPLTVGGPVRSRGSDFQVSIVTTVVVISNTSKNDNNSTNSKDNSTNSNNDSTSATTTTTTTTNNNKTNNVSTAGPLSSPSPLV